MELQFYMTRDTPLSCSGRCCPIVKTVFLINLTKAVSIMSFLKTLKDLRYSSIVCNAVERGWLVCVGACFDCLPRKLSNEIAQIKSAESIVSIIATYVGLLSVSLVRFNVGLHINCIISMHSNSAKMHRSVPMLLNNLNL